jgi:hypothetical protein
MIDQGFYLNLPAATYHADPCPEPSLSSSIAKILAFQTPLHAWQAHPRLNPDFAPGNDDKFDLGSVVHEVILGKGAGYMVIDFADWRTKAAQQARDDARGAGMVPILTKDWARVDIMSQKAVERLNGMGIDLSKNQNECVLAWKEGDVWLRAMLDSLDMKGVIYDVKTTGAGLSDGALMRQIANLGYDLSAAFYMRGLTTIHPEIAGRTRFRWIFIETDAPHEVRVIEASGMTMALGEKKVDFAIRKWSHCMATGEWPGYAPTITTLDYPNWAEAQWLEREMTDAMA